jgi:hypothetical protein
VLVEPDRPQHFDECGIDVLEVKVVLAAFVLRKPIEEVCVHSYGLQDRERRPSRILRVYPNKWGRHYNYNFVGGHGAGAFHDSSENVNLG